MSKRIKSAYTIIGLSKILFIAGALLFSNLVFSDDLERLFSTSAERKYLNKIRASGKVESMLPVSDTNIVPEEIENTPVKFNGFVKRSSGRRDAWVNGQHVGSDHMLIQKLDSQNRIRVKIPDSDLSVRMKPGQVLDPTTGRVSEVYDIQEPTKPLAEIEQYPE